MPTLVPARDFPNAVSLGVTVFYFAMIGGPSLAGFLLASHGPAMIYGINAASYLAVIAALIAMRASGTRSVERRRSGVACQLWRAQRRIEICPAFPIIVQTMTLDFAATFFASATALAADLRRQDPKRRRARVRFPVRGPGNRSRYYGTGDGADGNISPAGKTCNRISCGLWFGDGGVWFFARLLVFAADARAVRRGGHREHGAAANDSPAGHAGSSARPHDFDQYGLFHGWSAARRSRGRHGGCPDWRAALGGNQADWAQYSPPALRWSRRKA